MIEQGRFISVSLSMSRSVSLCLPPSVSLCASLSLIHTYMYCLASLVHTFSLCLTALPSRLPQMYPGRLLKEVHRGYVKSLLQVVCGEGGESKAASEAEGVEEENEGVGGGGGTSAEADMMVVEESVVAGGEAGMPSVHENILEQGEVSMDLHMDSNRSSELGIFRTIQVNSGKIGEDKAALLACYGANAVELS